MLPRETIEAFEICLDAHVVATLADLKRRLGYVF